MNFDDLKQQWQDLEEWKKLLIVIVFSGVFVYIIYIFKIEPTLQEKAVLQNEVQDLKNKVSYLKKRFNKQQIKKLEEQIRDIDKKMKEKQIELNKLKTIIPDKANLDKFLSIVTSNIQESNLILDKFSVKKEESVIARYDKAKGKVIFE